jgi:protein-S-isoprenylcysteine O-methyltransferase Ste14
MKPVLIPPVYFALSIILTPVFTVLLPGFNYLSFPLNLAGLLFIAAGLAISGIAFKQFKKAGTSERYEKSTTVVSDGVFSISRNPMYLGYVLVVTGESLLTQNLLSLIIPLFLFLILNYMFIPYEEQRMRDEQGDTYSDYMKKVRRWI